MSARAPSKPKLKPGTAADKAARTERLAAEMRNNLLKRKRQQREKTASSERDPANPSKP